MRRKTLIHLLLVLLVIVKLAGSAHLAPSFGMGKNRDTQSENQAVIVLRSQSLAPQGQGPDSRSLRLNDLFYETAEGRVHLPAQVTAKAGRAGELDGQARMADGRLVRGSVRPAGK